MKHTHTPVILVHSDDLADMRTGSYWHLQMFSEPRRIETMWDDRPRRPAMAEIHVGFGGEKTCKEYH